MGDNIMVYPKAMHIDIELADSIMGVQATTVTKGTITDIHPGTKWLHHQLHSLNYWTRWEAT
jgi:hypothetical protein